jgi:hypothetical protein
MSRNSTRIARFFAATVVFASHWTPWGRAENPIATFRPKLRSLFILLEFVSEDAMARFRWHADYFDGLQSSRCVRRAIIPADNAGEAERIAEAQMGSCARVEVRRVATAAPVRVIYAAQAGDPASQQTGIFALAAIAAPGAIAN